MDGPEPPKAYEASARPRSPTVPDLPDPARLQAVAETGLLHAETTAALDRLARVARHALGGSFALVTLPGADRQIVEGRAGTVSDEAPVVNGLCQRTVAHGAPLVLPDTAADPLTRDLPAEGVAAYAGVPLRAAGGEAFGSLAVCADRPRAWTDDDVEVLTVLAESASAEMAARAPARGPHGRQRQAAVADRDRSATRFEALLDGISVLTGLLAPDGTVLEANRTALAFAGRDRGDVVGRALWDALRLPPDVEVRHRDAVARAARGAAVRYEETLVDHDGRPRVLEVGLQPTGPDGLLLLEGRDVTEAVRLRHVQSAMMAGLAGTWELDLATGQATTDGGTDTLFELPPVGGPRPASAFFDRIHPDDVEAARRAVEASVASGGEHAVTYRVVRADGSVRWVRSQGIVVADRAGQPVRLVGALADITGPRQEAEATARTALELQLALDAGGMGRWEAGPDGSVHQDDRARAVHGLGPGTTATVGDSVAAVHPDDLDGLMDVYRAALAGGSEARLDHEYRVVHPDGAVRWVRASGQARPDGEGLLGVAWDVTDEREAEARLRRKRRQLELALLAARLGTFDHDLATDEVAFDDRALEVLGLAPDDRYPDLVARTHPDDRSQFAEVRERLRRAPGLHPFSFEYRVADGDGGWRTVQASARGVTGPDGSLTRISGAVRDVTAERHDQEALRRLAVRKALLLDLAQAWRQQDRPAEILGTAAAALGRHLDTHRVGFFEVADDRALDVDPGPSWTDGTLGPLSGTTPADALGPADAAETRAGRATAIADVEADPRTAGSALSGAGVRSGIGVPVLRGGAWVAGLYVHHAEVRAWTDAELDLVREVAEQVWDAVARVRAVAALRDSEARFRSTFENAAVGIAHVGLDGAWLRVNRRLSEIVGYTRDELLALTFQDITHADDLGTDQALFDRLLAGEIDHYQLEKRYLHRDGRAVWINLTVALAHDADGRPTHAISVIEDVSAKKAAEAELVALNAVLEERVADRTAELARSNDELDRFAYVASHDLKAPIRAIDSLAAWIAEDAGDVLPPDSAEHLRLLRGRAERMEGLLDGLLAYSRAGRGEAAPEPVDVGVLVAEAVETVAPPQGFDVAVEVHAPPVVTERVPLALVVRNLVGNAIKHHDRPDGRVTVEGGVEGGLLTLEVRDDGPGIAAAYQERVFEMFQTLRPRDEVEASGMGLAIVKKTVEARGGTGRAHSPEASVGCDTLAAADVDR